MSRMVTCGPLEFAYERFGDTADSTFVLIRGLGTQMIEWGDAFIAALVAAGLQVLIFDNRDVAESSKLGEQYTLTDMAADVVDIMAALGIGRAHIFGISLGGDGGTTGGLPVSGEGVVAVLRDVLERQSTVAGHQRREPGATAGDRCGPGKPHQSQCGEPAGLWQPRLPAECTTTTRGGHPGA